MACFPVRFMCFNKLEWFFFLFYSMLVINNTKNDRNEYKFFFVCFRYKTKKEKSITGFDEDALCQAYILHAHKRDQVQ